MLIDSRLMKHRISNWHEELVKHTVEPTKDLIKQGIDCPFERFNNSLDSDFGEEGVFCKSKTYTYPATGPLLDAAISQATTSYPRRLSPDLYLIYEHPFEVRGV